MILIMYFWLNRLDWKPICSILKFNEANYAKSSILKLNTQVKINHSVCLHEVILCFHVCEWTGNIATN